MTTATARPDRRTGTALQAGGRGWQQPLQPNSLTPWAYGVEPTWTRRPTITVDKPKKQKQECPFLQPCLEWLKSPHAIASAVELLNQHGVKVDADEVVNDVAIKIWLGLTKNPHTVIENIRGYCYMALRNHIVDLLSGGKRSDIDVEDLADDDDPLEGILGNIGSDAEASEDDVDLYDQLRAFLESSGKKPKVISAALSYLSVRRFDDIDVSDLKAPVAGARPDQALWWPCLWLAEYDERMFPPERTSGSFILPTEEDTKVGNAQRRARNYAVQRARDLLAAGSLHVRGAR